MIETIRNSRASEYQTRDIEHEVANTERKGREGTGPVSGPGADSASTHSTLIARAPYESFDFGAVHVPPAAATLSRYIENHKVATHTVTVEGTAADRARSDAVRAHLREYTMRAGNGVEYTVPFRMAQGPKEVAAANRELVKALGGDGAPGTRHAPMVVLGRATPQQLREVCDALSRRHPGEFDNSQNARAFLSRLRVGVDCAGFVQNTLSALTGRTPPLGLRDKGMEDLSRLGSNPNFKARTSPAEARPGDVITLKPTAQDGVGHTLIVTERASIAASSLRSNDFELRPDDKLTRLSVAASWGGQGPKECDWVYNARTGRWGEVVGNEVVASRDPRGPYHHGLESIWGTRN